jgi:hypothetical protein
MPDWAFYGILGGFVLATLFTLALAIDLATRGPERRAAKRLRALVRDGRLTVKPSLKVIRAMPRRREERP